MGRGIRLGSLLGFEIRLDYSWFLVFFLMAFSLSQGLFPGEYQFGPALSWTLGISAALLLFASVLVHEIAHALVARHYGIEVQGITLFLFGGVAQIRGEPETPRQELMIAGAGPLISVALGIACLLGSWAAALLRPLFPVAALLNYLGWINLFLAAFNMIPGFPMDGGRILRSAIWHVTGDLDRATRWASLAGSGFAWLLIGFGILSYFTGSGFGALWLVFIGWFLYNAARTAYQQLRVRTALSAVPVTDAMLADLPAVDADMRVREFVDQYLLRRQSRVFPVVRGEELVGLITLEQVRRLDREYWGVTAVGAIARSPEEEQAMDAGRSAWEALGEMAESETGRLLVFGEGRLRGIVTQDSIMQLLQRRLSLGLDPSRPAGKRPAPASRTRGLAP